MALSVVKFGGSSLKDKESILRVSKIIENLVQSEGSVVAVVSAQGKTTDRLQSKAYELSEAPSLREVDVLLSAGEIVSSALMAVALKSIGVSAVSLAAWQVGIKSDSVHGNAKIKAVGTNRILSELNSHQVVVVTGFQAVDEFENTTTLGRGGSDTSAVALAAALGCSLCKIYTDVDGVDTADPRRVKVARKIKRLGYTSMRLLAENGAGVLHDRCVASAMNSGVEIEVLSSFAPGSGTLVSGSEENNVGPIGIALSEIGDNIARVSIIGRRLLSCKTASCEIDKALREFTGGVISVRNDDIISVDMVIPEAYRLEELLHRAFFE